MIIIERMELSGKCANPLCAHDKRDGEEVSCIQKLPQSNHVADHLCKFCQFWVATDPDYKNNTTACSTKETGNA